MLTLRDYQREAVDTVLASWSNEGTTPLHPLIEAATGTGKSVMIAALIREVLTAWADLNLRVLVLTHVKELVEQNAKELLGMWPAAPIGINAAGLGRRDWHNQIVFASIQSVYRQAQQLGRRDLVIIDEAHLVPRSGEGMYRALLDDLGAMADIRVVGFTATPYRLDSGRLDEGDGRLFSRIVYAYGIGRGIADGHLAPLVSRATQTVLDVTGVDRRGGEFAAGSLEAAVDRDDVTESAVAELVRLGADRRSWLLFGSGVRHARNLRDAVRRYGIPCEMVTGETPVGERDRIVADFREGRLRCLTNCSVLTTGFNARGVDLIGMLRPTLSPGLYTQIVGRGTRTAAGKTDCLVLDYAGNVRRHGPVDALVIPSRKPGLRGARGAAESDQVRAKTCPTCQTLVALAAESCDRCGHEWIVEVKHGAKADTVHDIISGGAAPVPEPKWLDVTEVSYHRHRSRKPGKPDSLRVEFRCGIAVHRHWVHLERSGPMLGQAVRWWRRMGGGDDPPASVTEALERADTDLVWPHQIQLRKRNQYFDVVDYRFAADGDSSSHAIRHAEAA
ncbi:hypothetical protein SB2_06940 [Methylobacterium radiotolerans]|nr:hypothetical protein SB3_08985 [Methylobacterium radiotolerans]KTS49278.1 hypothetical protein SB2_06940 [Methylobacterium radiotolerans]